MSQDADDLLRRLREGDDSPLRTIYRDCRTPFIRWIRQEFSCTEEDAIEFFQTAVVIFYDNVITGKLSELHGEVQGYLFSIGRNKAHEWLRHRRRQGHEATDLLLAHLKEDHPDEDEQEFAHQLQTVKGGLEQLGEPCRSVLEYFYYFQWTMQAISEKMGYKNEDTVKTLKYKCLQRLQKLCVDLKSRVVG